MKQRITSVFTGLLFSLVAVQTQAGWIDWTSSTTGTLDIGGTSVGVTLSGNPNNYVDGDYYYNNGATGYTDAGGTYGGMAPTDFIQVVAAGNYTLTFDQAVDDLYMSLISVGQPNYPVTYSFNDAFTVESYGANYWGYGGYAINGNNFTGTEFNGILHFAGSFTSISFAVSPYENWHGFNFASFEQTQVSEPASAVLLTLGLLGLFSRRLLRG